MNPQITQGIDVASLTLYAFFLFFLGLVFYLRREDRREGYPLEDEMSGRIDTPGGPLSTASPKTFKLPFGHGTVSVPNAKRDPFDIKAYRTDRFGGAPIAPTGNPLVDGIGPAAWAERAKRPDIDYEGHARIVPMDTAEGFFIAKGDPDPRGMPVLGADDAVAGTVTNLWIDKADRLVRYLEIAINGVAGQHVLAPMTMAVVNKRRGVVIVDALLASQFAGAPAIAAKDTITLYEEERIVAYFGGGYLYATRERQEPFL
ncbi:photosynthetic reaction center subunit H [Sphingobium algorifonticola]|uniref:Photosynthetic reaction center subunit H n=1 Tax=Sphingobium algorifonticola TaxID=2008318 RepID=A0A437J5K5_9SPHN|nr:photosynthetic reaction center subunit H [Sphingobium algorifonticola]RVT40215.1 photosynthetic reaction center subunit H [Sphingobium algorifonticola]